MCRRNTDENGPGSGQVGVLGVGGGFRVGGGSILSILQLRALLSRCQFLEIKKRVNIQVFCVATY